MKLAACGRLDRLPLTGRWFRALRLKYFNDRLATDHTRTKSSRFSAGTEKAPLYRILYLGETHQIAIHEVGALLGDPAAPVANPRGSWVILNFEVVLNEVVDLSRPEQQRLIRTTESELTGNWVNDPGIAPTQQLGAALYGLPGLEGFLYKSSQLDGRCLVVFPDKLGERSRILFENELTPRSVKEAIR